MELIKQSVERIEEINPLKLIEIAGRVCYKSEEKQTADSWKTFYKKLIKSGHTSVLEHGHVYFEIDLNSIKNTDVHDDLFYYVSLARFNFNNDINLFCKINNVSESIIQVYTNLRFVLEKTPELFDSFIQFYLDENNFNVGKVCEGIECFMPKFTSKFKRTTFRIITDRGISHELVRHRDASFSQESTRYCNYSEAKDKHVKYIIPVWLEDNLKEGIITKSFFAEPILDDEIYRFIVKCSNNELNYNADIIIGYAPGQARNSLNHHTKTEVIMSNFDINWKGWIQTFDINIDDEDITVNLKKGFVPLRLDKAAHVQIQPIAKFVNDYFNN